MHKTLWVWEWYILNMMLLGEMRIEGKKIPDKKITLGFIWRCVSFDTHVGSK